MKHGYATRFKRRGDLVQTPVRSAKNGLVAQAHTGGLKLADAGGQAFGFVVKRVVPPDLRTGWPNPSLCSKGERQHAL